MNVNPHFVGCLFPCVSKLFTGDADGAAKVRIDAVAAQLLDIQLAMRTVERSVVPATVKLRGRVNMQGPEIDSAIAERICHDRTDKDARQKWIRTLMVHGQKHSYLSNVIFKELFDDYRP